MSSLRNGVAGSNVDKKNGYIGANTSYASGNSSGSGGANVMGARASVTGGRSAYSTSTARGSTGLGDDGGGSTRGSRAPSRSGSVVGGFTVPSIKKMESTFSVLPTGAVGSSSNIFGGGGGTQNSNT
jgi:hypothetical protein